MIQVAAATLERADAGANAAIIPATAKGGIPERAGGRVWTIPGRGRKRPSCACGHDAHEGPCPHGKGTAFGGCPCPGMHGRGRRKANDTTATRFIEHADLSVGARRITVALAQHDILTAEQLTILLGYKKSSRDTYLRKLRTIGAIEKTELQTADGAWTAWTLTHEGRSLVGTDYERLPTGDALRDYWQEKLPEGESILLTIITSAYPEAVDRDALSKATGYKKSSRDTYLRKLLSRRLITRTAEGLRADPMLFDERGGA